jgi:hypothetical protein
MCRNIRVLHHFEPPTTPEEIRAAALQYVRKVAGLRTPAKADTAEIERAVEAVTKATTRLLDKLPHRGEPRTREGERERGRERWVKRAARIASTSSTTAPHEAHPHPHVHESPTTKRQPRGQSRR